MNINKHIVDQRIRKIVLDYPDFFRQEKDDRKQLSKAFIALAVASYLDIELEEAFGLVTEGGNDAGVDALYVGDVNDYDFSVTVFQGKYSFDLSKENNFPANAVQRVIGSISAIFDPNKPLEMNNDLMPKVEDIRSLIADGYIPNICCVFVNNGLKWNQDGDNHILNAGFSERQVKFDYFNHSDIVNSIQSKKGIDESLQFTGKSIQEGFNFKRVMIGKVKVSDIANLFDKYGDDLLNRNIRNYLGINKNRVNSDIRATLTGNKRDNFYFYNNGITMICKKFYHNDLQELNWKVRIEDLQIINGGQTCKTIQQTIHEYPEIDYSNTFVLVRLYELAGDDDDTLVTNVTIATNSQNPVDLRDLRANDDLQKGLDTAIAGLGYFYKRKKDAVISVSDKTIYSSVAAESVFAIWRRKPIQAKFKRNELFGVFYHDVFDRINAAQLIIAVLIFRFCDVQRKKIKLQEQYPHIPYSNYFIAMLLGEILLEQLDMKLEQLTHISFESAQTHFEKNRELLFMTANDRLNKALSQLYPTGYESIEKRRLAATFRRGDLMSFL